MLPISNCTHVITGLDHVLVHQGGILDHEVIPEVDRVIGDQNLVIGVQDQDLRANVPGVGILEAGLYFDITLKTNCMNEVKISK